MIHGGSGVEAMKDASEGGVNVIYLDSPTLRTSAAVNDRVTEELTPGVTWVSTKPGRAVVGERLPLAALADVTSGGQYVSFGGYLPRMNVIAVEAELVGEDLVVTIMDHSSLLQQATKSVLVLPPKILPRFPDNHMAHWIPVGKARQDFRRQHQHRLRRLLQQGRMVHDRDD